MTRRRSRHNEDRRDFLSSKWAGDSIRSWIRRLCMFMLLPPAGVAFLTWWVQGWNAGVFLRLKIMTFFALVIVAFTVVHYCRYHRQSRAQPSMHRRRPRDF